MNVSKIFVESQLKRRLDDLAHVAATSPKNDLKEPTEGQKKAGNYKKGHLRLHGMDISIENPRGSMRSGISPDGKPWNTKLKNHYGYIKKSISKDGDHLDCFIGNSPDSKTIFIINQRKYDGGFDEHKALLGFNKFTDALIGYLNNYEAGWERKGLFDSIHRMDIGKFKDWLKNGNTKMPFRGE